MVILVKQWCDRKEKITSSVFTFVCICQAYGAPMQLNFCYTGCRVHIRKVSIKCKDSTFLKWVSLIIAISIEVVP